MPRHAGVMALVGALLVGCSALPPQGSQAAPTAGAPVITPDATAQPTLPAETEALQRGLPPIRVSIPAIALDSPLVDLGITAEGRMQVPADYDDVGWFTGGGMPGGYGPIVIAAHVDSPTGPAAFVRLNELAPDDEVLVTDTAGSVHRYRVVEVVDYPKAAFPTARVFGAVAADELRLITCGGVFDSDAGSYVDNRVVYAVRA